MNEREDQMSQAAYPGTDEYSMAELMTVEMSRNLAALDGKHGGVGMDSQIPASAIRLAQLTVAPSLTFFCAYTVNPTSDRMPSIGSWSPYGAEDLITMTDDVVSLGLRGRGWGFGFNGGIQVDKYGNLNMLGIGPIDDLKVRGPGAIGLAWTATFECGFIYMYHHARRSFVEKVDYVSGPGFLDGGQSRWKIIKPFSKGPQLVYTPICTMDFEKPSQRMRLRSVNPGYTVEDVVANTGFDLVIPEKVPTTKPPTLEELTVLRSCVDRDRILHNFKRLTVG
jgi:glutaconate CoA-transferase, subunit B